MTQKQEINIMTSCDNNLAKQIPVLLQSIADNLAHKKVNFFLFHSSVEEEKIQLMQKLCAHYGNISFYEVVVPHPEIYAELAKRGGGWSGAAYYSLCAHQLLSDEVDRVLYLDAGDVLVMEDIDPYYYADFEGKSIIATMISYKTYGNKMEPFEAEDMAIQDFLKHILRGVFNSGSYILNLDKIRKDGYTLGDFCYLSDRIAEMQQTNEKAYFGDQGLLSAAYVGDIKYYDFPEFQDLWHMPYNFCLWYFNSRSEAPDYETKIVHFAGAPFKPWRAKYERFLEAFQEKEQIHDLAELKAGQVAYYEKWYEYARRVSDIIDKL